jgi:RES domain-containing protein
MIEIWRIVKAEHKATAFDGEGARLHGGRWNSPGKRVVYCASSVSLATLEMLVHLPRAVRLPAFVVPSARLPEKLFETLDPGHLPRHWLEHPAPHGLQVIGDAWLASARSVALRVPSAVVPLETNVLLNPGHPDFAKVEFGTSCPFPLDPRLKR